MKKLASVLVLSAGVGLLSAELVGQEALYRSDQILVKPAVPADELTAFHAALGTEVRKTFPRFGNLQVLRIPPGAGVEDTIAEYKRAGVVEYAEPDYIGRIHQNEPNDPGYTSGNLWGLTNALDADIDRRRRGTFGRRPPASSWRSSIQGCATRTRTWP